MSWEKAVLFFGEKVKATPSLLYYNEARMHKGETWKSRALNEDSLDDQNKL